MPRIRRTTEERLRALAEQEAKIKDRKRKALAKQREEQLAASKHSRKARDAALFTLGGAILAASKDDPALTEILRKALENVLFRPIDVEGMLIAAPWLLPEKHRPADLPAENG